MQTAYFFKNMHRDQETELLAYVEKKLPRLTKLLKRYPADGVRLYISGEKYDKHSAFNVELKLTIGSDDYVGSEASHVITKAVDFSVDRLEMQLKKASEMLQRSHRSMKTRRAIKQTAGALA